MDVPMRNSKKHDAAEIPAITRKHMLLACVSRDWGGTYTLEWQHVMCYVLCIPTILFSHFYFLITPFHLHIFSLPRQCVPDDIEFCDEGDPDFEYKSLVKEANELASLGKWKTATRRLKKLKKRYVTPEKRIPQETYVAVLEACAANRLHGARASEPARKILEDMSEEGYPIPSGLGNGCIVSALGNGPGATHDGFGGVDCALAMLAALENSPEGSSMLTVDTYGKVVSALSSDGAVDEALLLLRAMVVEHSLLPISVPLMTLPRLPPRMVAWLRASCRSLLSPRRPDTNWTLSPVPRLADLFLPVDLLPPTRWTT